jgi:riboflavin biosynthesis pyrimidine reductase
MGVNGVSVDEHGGSRAISGVADRQMFLTLRRQAQAILVGSKTAATNDYGAFKPTPEIYVVTRSDELPPDSRLAREVKPAATVRPDLASLAALLADFRQRGLKNILCEGGVTLMSTLIEFDLLDELFITYRLRLLPHHRTPPGIAAPATNRRFELLSTKLIGDELLTHWRRN